MKRKERKVRTQGGFEVTLLTEEAKGDYPLVGLVHHRTCDEVATWTRDGKFKKVGDSATMDLVKECEE